MRKFPILADGYVGRSLTATKYLRTSDGVEIKIIHDIPDKTGVQYRWVQTVIENGSFFKACRRQHYVDPFKDTGAKDAKGNAVCTGDDTKPFYWTDDEFFGTHGVAKQGPFFYDKPSEGPPASGRTWIHFLTSIAEVTGKDVVILATLHWGFDRMANGDVRVAVLRRAAAADEAQHVKVSKAMFPTFNFSVALTPLGAAVKSAATAAATAAAAAMARLVGAVR